jgi:outer membrane lipoprotein SlyB
MANKSSELPSNRYERMKTMLIGLLSLGTVCSSQAQLFTSEGLTGAALGGVLGAVIGHNSGRHGGEGAAIGAGAGLLLGSLAHQANRDRYYYSYGYSDPSYAYYGYNGSYYPGYPGYYAYSRPSYALSGAALGAIGGAVIGHNSGRHAGEGAAIGAGAGLLLGSLADYNASRSVASSAPVHPAYYYSYPGYQSHSEPAPQAEAPAQNTTINYNHNKPSATPMSSANALFGR